jgi:hypothetical protein
LPPPSTECEGKPSRTFFATHLAITEPGWHQIAVVSNSKGEPIWRALVQDSDF